MTISEGDMLVINDKTTVLTGYVHGRIKMPYMDYVYEATVITESGEEKRVFSEQQIIEYKTAYNQLLEEMNAPMLIHGINNGYQEW